MSDQTLEEFINLFTQKVEDVSTLSAESAAREFINLCSALRMVEIEPEEVVYKIPYSDISRIMFSLELKKFNVKSFEQFNSLVSEDIEKQVGEPIEPENKNSSKYLICFLKFSRHISLAWIQKEFILQSSQQAEAIANNARNTAANAQDISIKANYLSDQAKKAYDDMLANYVSILGIFASIIITVFGGMQVFSASAKLLASDIGLASTILILSLVSLVIILLLAVLFDWITNIKENVRNYNIFYRSSGALFIIISICFIIVSCYPKKDEHSNSQGISDAPVVNLKIDASDDTKD